MNTSNPSATNNAFRILSDDGERIIGTILEGVFRKSKFQSSKHLCHKYQAIGIDRTAFETYIIPLAAKIEVLDKDSGGTYTVSVEDFRKHCIEDDLGWGSQLFCPIRFFKKADPNPNAARQLSLFQVTPC